MARKENVTMKDVARMAGVSVQTVSAVMNGKPGITPETSARVMAFVNKLGYRPFSVARSLRTRETHTIAMVVSDIANPSFATMASAAEDFLHSLGYTLVLYNTHDDVKREESYLQMASERWVDGMLIVSTRDQSDSLTALERSNIPFVVLDRSPEQHQSPCVVLDNEYAGKMAADHLLSLGHRRFAHISGPLRLRLSRERQQGFIDCIKANGSADMILAESSGWDCKDGYTAMQSILERSDPPTAIFAANDRNAMGAMLALYEKGLRVPNDVSVIGLDDIEASAFLIPPLTTIRQSFAELGTQAARLLLQLINQQPAQKLEIVIQPELIVRKSTAQPGRPSIT